VGVRGKKENPRGDEIKEQNGFGELSTATESYTEQITFAIFNVVSIFIRFILQLNLMKIETTFKKNLGNSIYKILSIY